MEAGGTPKIWQQGRAASWLWQPRATFLGGPGAAQSHGAPAGPRRAGAGAPARDDARRLLRRRLLGRRRRRRGLGLRRVAGADPGHGAGRRGPLQRALPRHADGRVRARLRDGLVRRPRQRRGHVRDAVRVVLHVRVHGGLPLPLRRERPGLLRHAPGVQRQRRHHRRQLLLLLEEHGRSTATCTRSRSTPSTAPART